MAFLDRHSLAAAFLFIALAAARIVSAYSENGITYDEPAHIACGMQFLAQHVYRYEAQHPPLARVMCALGPYLAGLHPAGQDDMTTEGTSILYENPGVAHTLLLDRLGILPFFILACLTVYFWGARFFSPRVGAFAVLLLTLTPVVLAHAGLGTTDMALTATMGAAFLALLIWAEKPTIPNGLWLGLAAGAALLAKFSTLVFLPASALAALLFYLAKEKPGVRALSYLARERAASFGAGALVALIVLHAGYLFSFGEVPGWGVWLPAPEFFTGIREVLEHNQWGHPAFFLGQFSRSGWWYYFPVMLVLKTPLSLLALAGIGAWAAWRKRASLAYAMPAALIAGVLLPSMAGHIDIGTRHIMPVYLAIAILGALGVDRLLAHGPLPGKLATAALILELIFVGALQHPNYLSYANELVRRPERLFADSDYDWGQGTPLLARRLRQLHADTVTCSFWYLTAAQLRIWPGLNVRPLDYQKPSPGWTAVSPTYWHLYGFVNHDEHVLNAWFANKEPDERLGGLLLYDVK